MSIELAVGAGFVEGGSRSMALVSNDDRVSTVEAHVALGAEGLGPLRFELVGRDAETDGRAYSDGRTATLDFQDVEAGVRLERPVSPRARAFVRAGLGMTFAHLVMPSSTGATRSLHGRGFMTNLGGGFDLTVMSTSRLELGVRIDFGFRLGQDLTFTADEGTSARAVSVYNGTLNPSGLTGGVSVFARF